MCQYGEVPQPAVHDDKLVYPKEFIGRSKEPREYLAYDDFRPLGSDIYISQLYDGLMITAEHTSIESVMRTVYRTVLVGRRRVGMPLRLVRNIHREREGDYFSHPLTHVKNDAKK